MEQGRQIAVIGAGLMGHGIALTFARSGFPVMIFDPAQDMLRTARARISDSLRLLGAAEAEIAESLTRIELCGACQAAVSDADFVFEAVPEKPELKINVFKELESFAPGRAILASNTSAIKISTIAGGLKQRGRVLGTHWWNPPHMIPLVEIIKTEWTESGAADSMRILLEKADKTPVLVEKDVPGFIGNRLQHALWREAISLVENGVCTAKAVDEVVKASFGRRLAVLGPLENADLVGIELTQDVQRQVLFDLENRTEPSPYLQELREDGRTGMAALAGFYDWQDGDLEKTKSRVARHLLRLEEILPK